MSDNKFESITLWEKITWFTLFQHKLSFIKDFFLLFNKYSKNHNVATKFTYVEFNDSQRSIHITQFSSLHSSDTLQKSVLIHYIAKLIDIFTFFLCTTNI